LITQLYTPADKEHNEHDLDGPGFFRKELLVPFRADVRHADHQIGEFQIVLEKA
jgi:hypothetical protein